MPQQETPITVAVALGGLTVEQLKPLAALLADRVPARKGELVQLVERTLLDPVAVRALYSGLDTLGKAAVREAVHAAGGRLDSDRYAAKYGQVPDFERAAAGSSSYWDRQRTTPTALRLFFPLDTTLPTDLLSLLQEFVRAPDPDRLKTLDDPLAAGATQAGADEGEADGVDGADDADDADDADQNEIDAEQIHVQPTEQAALHDVHAILRLIDMGKVGVSATTRRPGQAALRTVAAVLHSGDFYSKDDMDDEDREFGPAEDRSGIHIKSYAWPLIVQVAGFAEIAGAKLRLTPAGRKAAVQPAHEAIRTAWRKWVGTTTFDEFNRISEIKGQGGAGKQHLTAAAPRRRIVVDALAASPAGAWSDVDEFFRHPRATGTTFEVAREPWSLYIVDSYYGSLGYQGHHEWNILQGRYILALLFEYAATLGLVDVTYVSPMEARDDFTGMWGADDMAYLSRYDGLRAFRITPLGAWSLGQTARYEPAPLAMAPTLRVLPNLDVVVTAQKLAAGDELLLGRFAERTGDATWHLSSAKCIEALEEGLPLDQFREFLRTRGGAELPQTVAVFLDDIEDRARQLRDQGAARLVECQDAAVAQLITHDRVLRDVCLIAGERHIVFRAEDEARVRRRLRELGYPLQTRYEASAAR